MTQAELATAVAFSRASIANIEAGRQKLPLHQVYRLLAALELDHVSALLPEPVASAAAKLTMAPSIHGERNLSDTARAQIEAIYDEFAVPAA